MRFCVTHSMSDIPTQIESALANGDLLSKVNNAITAGSLENRDGETLTGALKEALVTDDGKILYPVNDGIPVLLEGESVTLEQLETA